MIRRESIGLFSHLGVIILGAVMEFWTAFMWCFRTLLIGIPVHYILIRLNADGLILTLGGLVVGTLFAAIRLRS